MQPILEETIVLNVITSDLATGAAVDADDTPTCEVFEDATDTAILSPTVTKRTGKTGHYRVPIACTAANGFEAGKSYGVVVSATVGGEDGKAIIKEFVLRAYSTDSVRTLIGTAGAGLTAVGVASIAANAITASALATDAVNEIQTGLATTAALTSVADALTDAATAINLVVDAINNGQITGAVNGGSPTTSVFIVDGDAETRGTTNDCYVDRFLTFTSGPNAGLSEKILDWDATSNTITTDPFPFTPADNNTFTIQGTAV